MAAMVLLVHPSPSVVRAAAMGLVASGGCCSGARTGAPAALAAAVVVLLVADPWLAGELGFVLSVLATGAIVLLGTADASVVAALRSPARGGARGPRGRSARLRARSCC